MSQTATHKAEMIQGRHRPYPSYKASGIEWLGEIPEQWELKRLKYISYTKGRIGWQGLRSDEFLDEGPYLITGMHFKEGDVDWESCYRVSIERYEMAPEIQVKPDDVIITKDGSIGKLAYIDNLPGPATLNSHLLVLRPLKSSFHPRFLYHLLASRVFQIYVQETQTGTTFYGITQESIESFPVILPSYGEQETIAAFLDRETAKIDALIAKKERLIELLQEKRIALISYAVTKGLDPGVKMKDSGIEWLGEIPEHWDFKRLKFLAKEPMKYGANESAELNDPTLPRFVRITDISDDGNLHEDTFRSLPEPIAADFLLQPGDILFARSGATVGKSFLYQESWGRACFAGYLVRLRPDIKKLQSRFAWFYTISTSYWSWISAINIQATIQNVSGEKYANLSIPLPPIQEQKSISSYLDQETAKIDALIGKVQEAMARLQEYRTALISAAVTGKIDVRNQIDAEVQT